MTVLSPTFLPSLNLMQDVPAQGLGLSALVVFSLYLLSFNLFITSTGEEREKRVLLALALTPARPVEIVVAKAIFYSTASLILGMIVVSTYDGLGRYVSPATQDIIGWAPEELVGKPWLPFIHPDDRELIWQKAQLPLQGQVVKEYRARSLHKDGSYRWISWIAFPVPEDRAFVAIGRDITEQLDAEQQERREEFQGFGHATSHGETCSG